MGGWFFVVRILTWEHFFHCFQREGGRERETLIGCLSCVGSYAPGSGIVCTQTRDHMCPDQGSNPQPRHVP